MDSSEIQQATVAVSNLLFPFTGGWTFHFELQKRLSSGYPRSVGRHPVPELIDRERRARLNARGQQFRSRPYIAITYTPPAVGSRKVANWLDRQSVVSGKSVSVRVDLGGRRIIKKKKK